MTLALKQARPILADYLKVGCTDFVRKVLNNEFQTIVDIAKRTGASVTSVVVSLAYIEAHNGAEEGAITGKLRGWRRPT
jgi:hypothetical protein